MKASRNTPTMAAVAAAAGVSQQTVSRVLNNHPSVSPKTSKNVHDAIAALGYRPNLAARALATGNTQTIGVLVSSTTLSGPSGALLGIERTARADGYWVSMAGLQYGTASEVADVVSHFIRQGVDGIIAVAQTHIAVDATIEAVGTMPTVLVTSGRVPNGCRTVDTDQAGGVGQLMTILRGLGHTRIAHISGPTGDIHAEVRAEAWRQALPEGVEPISFEGDWSSGAGYRGAMTLLASGQAPTAIFASNDRMAFGALRALYERGIKVPHDMSVVGFDDIEGSDCSIPPLTTFNQDHAALGNVAVELLLEAMEGTPARSVKIPGQLIVRASTAVPRE